MLKFIMTDWFLLLGYFSGFCTTLAFIPQVYKVWKYKKVNDISLSMFVIFTIGVFGWLIYAFLLKDIPLIIANIFTLFFALAILLGILKFK